uniref:DUF913 domain-containing protein n=1 Tax=Macrostomum lignano TaxID=282301 RepID=A0A1I8IXW9_9PLAT
MSPSPSLLDPLLQLVQWQAAPDNWLGLCIRSVRVLDCLCNLAASQARLPGVLFSALLGRLQAELQLQQQQPANCLQKLGLLKRLLHLLKRLVTEPDFADSVRRTVDSGQLLRLVRCLLDCAPALRFAGADLLAAYIQHEPSSLSAMQESGITDQVLDSLKVPQHRDLLLNLPPILAALSLNQRGADAVLRRGVLQQLVSIFADPAYLPALTAKKSMQPAAMLGSLASEVVRNDQRLKDAVVEAVKDSLTRLVEEAKASAAAAAAAAALQRLPRPSRPPRRTTRPAAARPDASFASSVSTGGAGSSGNGAAGTSNVGANATTGGAAAAASSDPGAASNRASRLLVFAQSMVYRTAIERADSQIAAGSVDSAASRALVDAGVLPLLLELAAQLRPAEPAIGHVATFIRLLVMADADPEQMVSTLLSLINDQLPSECNPRSAAICSLLERLPGQVCRRQPLLKKLLYQLYRTAAWQCAEAAHQMDVDTCDTLSQLGLDGVCEPACKKPKQAALLDPEQLACRQAVSASVRSIFAALFKLCTAGSRSLYTGSQMSLDNCKTIDLFAMEGAEGKDPKVIRASRDVIHCSIRSFELVVTSFTVVIGSFELVVTVIHCSHQSFELVVTSLIVVHRSFELVVTSFTSIRSFELVVTSFTVAIRSFELVVTSFTVAIRSFELVVTSFTVAIRSFELVVTSLIVVILVVTSFTVAIRSFELVVTSFTVAIRSFELVVTSFTVVIRSFELVVTCRTANAFLQLFCGLQPDRLPPDIANFLVFEGISTVGAFMSLLPRAINQGFADEALVESWLAWTQRFAANYKTDDGSRLEDRLLPALMPLWNRLPAKELLSETGACNLLSIMRQLLAWWSAEPDMVEPPMLLADGKQQSGGASGSGAGTSAGAGATGNSDNQSVRRLMEMGFSPPALLLRVATNFEEAVDTLVRRQGEEQLLLGADLLSPDDDASEAADDDGEAGDGGAAGGAGLSAAQQRRADLKAEFLQRQLGPGCLKVFRHFKSAPIPHHVAGALAATGDSQLIDLAFEAAFSDFPASCRDQPRLLQLVLLLCHRCKLSCAQQASSSAESAAAFDSLCLLVDAHERLAAAGQLRRRVLERTAPHRSLGAAGRRANASLDRAWRDGRYMCRFPQLVGRRVAMLTLPAQFTENSGRPLMLSLTESSADNSAAAAADAQPLLEPMSPAERDSLARQLLSTIRPGAGASRLEAALQLLIRLICSDPGLAAELCCSAGLADRLLALAGQGAGVQHLCCLALHAVFQDADAVAYAASNLVRRHLHYGAPSSRLLGVSGRSQGAKNLHYLLAVLTPALFRAYEPTCDAVRQLASLAIDSAALREGGTQRL